MLYAHTRPFLQNTKATQKQNKKLISEQMPENKEVL